MVTYSFSVYLQSDGRMMIRPHSGLSTKSEEAILIGVDELVDYVNKLIVKEEV